MSINFFCLYRFEPVIPIYISDPMGYKNIFIWLTPAASYEAAVTLIPVQ